MSHWPRRKQCHFQKRVTSQPNPISFKWSHSVKLRSIHICVSLATMETVAIPKESDIAAKPNLVQVVPLCQIALDPHLCLIGNDGNGGISKKRVTSQQKPSLVQMVPTLSNCTRSSSVSPWLQWKRWHCQKRVTSQPNPVSFKWSHSVKLRSIHICVSLATMETVAIPKESDIAAKPNLVQVVPLCQNCA